MERSVYVWRLEILLVESQATPSHLAHIGSDRVSEVDSLPSQILVDPNYKDAVVRALLTTWGVDLDVAKWKPASKDRWGRYWDLWCHISTAMFSAILFVALCVPQPFFRSPVAITFPQPCVHSCF